MRVLYIPARKVQWYNSNGFVAVCRLSDIQHTSCHGRLTGHQMCKPATAILRVKRPATMALTDRL